MSTGSDPLERIAAALERLAPPAPAAADWLAHPAYVWTGSGTRAVDPLEAPPLGLIKGVDAQKAAVADNVLRLAAGAAAHDMLLWGSRGMGKSAMIRAAVRSAQAAHPGRIALIQAAPDESLAALLTQLRAVDRSFLILLDDLGFDAGDAGSARRLRSWLEGGVEARPANVRLAVTSNRRAIVERHMAEQDDPINPRDVVDDRLALADRFGLSLGFHACSQDDYLAIIAGYCAHFGLTFAEDDALAWSKQRGGRSGRVAWQFINELAGRANRNL
ncbi:ATP-binding protein [Novosphingobium sp. PASSN1]|uniref:ATP-binding protein n=1 Tax=Novosphingobium sp. PASSN1 TaxID=2015561 RepID=UPI000BD54C07|nr:ATP-binding protein [Novosphingobium sp. PASSN1]OYU36549.1 MAG: ATPase [Novosphingobium sp. PASSN1]